MLSKRSLSSFLFGCALLTLSSGLVQAQDMEDFKTRMENAAAQTKTNMSEALRQYLEIRVQYAGYQVDYSLGRAYQRMFQCTEAKHYYTQVMVNYELDESNDIYSRAVKAYDEISECESWQKVTISCTKSSDDYLMIDDEKMSDCWERPYLLPDGEHTIKLVNSKTGKEYKTTFVAKANEAQGHIDIAFPVEHVENEAQPVQQCSPVKTNTQFVEYKDRFHPAIYWSLISSGVLFLAGSGWFAAMANNSLVDVQKYEDMYAITGDAKAKKDADSARDKVSLSNILTYSSLGLGGALAITGISLAIVNAVSDKKKVDSNASAFVSPSNEGLMVGFGMHF